MAQHLPRAASRAAPRPAGPAPTRASLHEAALRHLARFAATEAGLIRVLDRRVQRWARAAAAESQPTEAAAADARAAVRQVTRALAQAGVLDDRAFATAQAARLVRSGRSRRAASARLQAKGVPPDLIDAALPRAETELPAALAFARRRRIGPFRPDPAPEPTPGTRLRDLAAFARAGFPRDIAERALSTGRDAALSLVLALKRG